MAAAPTLNEIRLKEHYESCKSAGMPIDQTARFTNAGYFPTRKQQLFHAACRECDSQGGPVLILTGGSRSGGSHHRRF